MNDSIRALLHTIRELRELIEKKPDIHWATVTAATPLRVRLDGEEDEVEPESLIHAGVVGERVLCVKTVRRLIVIQSVGTEWVQPTLGNGFTHHPTSPLQYRAKDGRIALRGATYRAAPATDYLTLFHLPDVSIRPAGQVRAAGRADAGQWTAVTNAGEVQMLITRGVTGGVGLPVDGINWDY